MFHQIFVNSFYHMVHKGIIELGLETHYSCFAPGKGSEGSGS